MGKIRFFLGKDRMRRGLRLYIIGELNIWCLGEKNRTDKEVEKEGPKKEENNVQCAQSKEEFFYFFKNNSS